MSEQNGTTGVLKRQRSSPYPRFNLQEIEKFARIVYDQGPRNCDQDSVAKKAGYSGANNGSFLSIRSAANQFGLTVAKAERISVSEEWIGAFLEDNEEALNAMRRVAFHQPTIYKKLIETYKDRQLPTPDKIARVLYFDESNGITKEAAGEAVKVFLESAKYAQLIDDKNFLQSIKLNQKVDDLSPEPLEKELFPKDINQRNVQQSSQQNTQGSIAKQGIDNSTSTLSIANDMEKQELTFKHGKKAYFIVPVPLPAGEKARLTKWLEVLRMQIELTLEEEPEYQVEDNNL